MRAIYYKGENILVRWSVVDKTNAPIPFAQISNVTVVVTDKQGNLRTFSKTGGTIVQGLTANEYQFELTEAMTTAFSPGKLSARFTYIIPSGDYASNQLVDIIEEGITSDFITLQQ
jgi:hypothetical protein